MKNNQLIERINNAKFNSNKRKFLINETIIDNAEDLDTDDWLNNLGESTESSKPHKKQKTTIVKSNQMIQVQLPLLLVILPKNYNHW